MQLPSYDVHTEILKKLLKGNNSETKKGKAIIFLHNTRF